MAGGGLCVEPQLADPEAAQPEVDRPLRGSSSRHIRTLARTGSAVGAQVFKKVVAFGGNSDEPACSALGSAPGDAELGDADGNTVSPMRTPKSRSMSVEREDSIMGEVQGRILKLQGLCSASGVNSMSLLPAPTTPASSLRGGPKMQALPSECESTPAARGQRTPSNSARDELSHVTSECVRAPSVPFGPAVVCTVTSIVVMACFLMYLPLEIFTKRLQAETMESYTMSTDLQSNLTQKLTCEAATWAYSQMLRSLGTMIETNVVKPPDQSLEALWGTMQTYHAIDGAWSGASDQQRYALSYRALTELDYQYKKNAQVQTGFLYVGFQTGEFAGASIVDHFSRHAGGLSTASLLVANMTLAAAEAKCRQLQGCAGFSVDGNETVGQLEVAFKDTWQLDSDEDATSFRYDEAYWYAGSGDGLLRISPASLTTHRPLNRSHGSAPLAIPFDPTERPWYAGQKALMTNRSSPASRLWSNIYLFAHPKVLGLTRTLPMSFCGTYSCMEGVLGADITLPVVSQGCKAAWLNFKQLLRGSAYDFPLDAENSGIFVVNHVTAHLDQEGLLVGASNDKAALDTEELSVAEESSDTVVRLASRALLLRFGNWSSERLGAEQQSFSFSTAYQDLRECLPQDADCMQVCTLSVEIGEGMRWLVVMVSPAAAFDGMARKTRESVDSEFQTVEGRIQLSVEHARYMGLLVFAAAALVSLAAGLALAVAISRPLRKLKRLMQQLTKLSFEHMACDRASLPSAVSCQVQIQEVSDLQENFVRLSRAIETFARFVPEAVVRSIVGGDERFARLHVTRKTVTIMFSDIKDFTAISETLRDRDLIFLLTRYLSIMTRIVEGYDGTVAEILGDGMLIYWNTPTDVENHACKACMAALAMQQALVSLNAELDTLSLPALAVRIGLHTGVVLTGNIGSDMKMKFGCIGDAVNLASRLEGLCKVYGVGTVCSSSTYEQLPAGHDVICRRLDIVQVKGRKDPVLLYEVMGADHEGACTSAEEDVVVTHNRSEAVCSQSSYPQEDVVVSHNRSEAACSQSSYPQDASPTVSPRSVARGATVGQMRSMASQTARSRNGTGSLMGSVASSMGFTPKCSTAKTFKERKTFKEMAKLAVADSAQSLRQSQVVDNDALRKLKRIEQKRPGEAAMSPDSASSQLQSEGRGGGSDAAHLAHLRSRARVYEEALTAYQEARFREARDIARTLATASPPDRAAGRLLQLAGRFLDGDRVVGFSDAEREAWTGISVMTEK